VTPSIATLPLDHLEDGDVPIEQLLDNHFAPLSFGQSSAYKLLVRELHMAAGLDHTYPEHKEEQSLDRDQFHLEEVLGAHVGDLESWLLEHLPDT